MAKNPILAAALSVIIAGFGQFYLGQAKRGLFFLALEFLTAIIHIEFSRNIGYALNFLASIWAATDAYRTAKHMRENTKTPDPAQEIYI
ncbi:MAG: hypothetical protein ABH834_03535 [Candidatus Altiarchaeota archaeon]